MTYESAPATVMIATNCAVCNRPLVDAKSVETGMGPDCRAKYGYDDAPTSPDWNLAAELLGGTAGALVCAAFQNGCRENDPRRVANACVYQVALNRSGPLAGRFCATIAALGFKRLAASLGAKLGACAIETVGATLRVTSPYQQTFIEKARVIRGASFDKTTKAWVFPTSERAAVWNAICDAYPGTAVFGTRIAIVPEPPKIAPLPDLERFLTWLRSADEGTQRLRRYEVSAWGLARRYLTESGHTGSSDEAVRPYATVAAEWQKS